MRFSSQRVLPEKEGLVGTLSRIFNELERIFSAGLTFGDGTDADNVSGKWLTYSSNVTPNTDDSLTHNLGVIPVGFILMIPPLSGVINKGSVAWTTTTISLRCSAASQTAKIFLLLPPPQS